MIFRYFPGPRNNSWWKSHMIITIDYLLNVGRSDHLDRKHCTPNIRCELGCKHDCKYRYIYIYIDVMMWLSTCDGDWLCLYVRYFRINTVWLIMSIVFYTVQNRQWENHVQKIRHSVAATTTGSNIVCIFPFENISRSFLFVLLSFSHFINI